jgi:DNA-binding MarR family transcriptional regulator
MEMMTKLKELHTPCAKLIFLAIEFHRTNLEIVENREQVQSSTPIKHSLTIDDIARMVSMDRSNVYGYLKDLEKGGHIHMVKNQRRLEVLL